MRFAYFFFLSLGFVSPCSRSADLSTTNRESLNRFFQIVDNQRQPIKVLSFGDSMANSYQSLGFVMMRNLTARLGIAGYSFDNFQNATMYNVTNGVQAMVPSDLWFTYYYEVPAGGVMWWEKQYSPGGVQANQVGIFFVAQPNGGNFTLSVSTNTGPWKILLTLDGYSPGPAGRYTNVALNLDFYRMRIDGGVGTNVILGQQLLNTHSTGVHVCFVETGGISLNQITNVPRAIRDPVFKALAPDLLIWHMKEDGTEATRLGLLECEDWWSNSIPECSILYIGTPYISLDNSSTWTADQNTLVRSVAVANHHAYMDCMTPSVSYDWMVSNAYMLDGTHENLQGNEYLSGFVWDDLGFFSIRAPKTLAISPSKSGLDVSYLTAPGLRYSLESSAGLLNWRQLTSFVADGSTVTNSVLSNGLAQYFRLRLAPK